MRATGIDFYVRKARPYFGARKLRL
ncbi:hypothetical protein ACLBR5_12475 [Escherichia coli]